MLVCGRFTLSAHTFFEHLQSTFCVFVQLYLWISAKSDSPCTLSSSQAGQTEWGLSTSLLIPRTYTSSSTHSARVSLRRSGQHKTPQKEQNRRLIKRLKQESDLTGRPAVCLSVALLLLVFFLPSLPLFLLLLLCCNKHSILTAAELCRYP